MAYSQSAGNDVGNANMPYRAGDALATSGVNPPGKLWIPIWSGEVINAYDQYNKFEGMVDSKTISSGTTMEFPITGTVSLKPSWSAGEELIGGENATATTFQVKLDARPMAAHFELDNIDLMVSQWEYRTELARQAGMTLANTRDKQIATYIARAGAEDACTQDPRGTSLMHGGFYSTDYNEMASLASGDATAATTACLLLLKNIEDWMVHLQTKDISTEGVYCAVEPGTFANIRALGVARVNADLGGSTVAASEPLFAGIAERGGLGSSLAGRPHIEDTLEYMGCTICKTNHGPFGVNYNLAGGANKIGEGRYNLNFLGETEAFDGPDLTTEPNYLAAPKAILWQRNCVAAMKLQGLKVDVVDDVRRNTTFTVASMMSGTGVLRPECAAIVVDTTETGTPASAGTVASTRAHCREAWGMTAEYVNA
jgi:hypothetical protein